MSDFPDPDEQVVYYIQPALDDIAPGATCGVMVPERRRPGQDPPHILVATDMLTETHAWQRPGAATMEATIRITAWADTLMEAKRIAREVHALLMFFPGRPALGVTADMDPESHSPIASFTAVLTFRPVTA